MTDKNLPKPLQQLTSRYGITADDGGFILAMMELAYQAGEKNAWGESSQEPALFMSEPVRKDLVFPELDKIWFDDIKPKQEDPVYQLSQPDVNYLRPFLSELSSAIQYSIALVKDDEEFYFTHSSEETPEGQKSFRALNQTRNEIRRLRKHQKRIDNIIRQFKYGV